MLNFLSWLWTFVKQYLTYVLLGVGAVGYAGYYGYSYYVESRKSDSDAPQIITSKDSYVIGDIVVLKAKHNIRNIQAMSVEWKVFDGYNEKTDFTKLYDNSVVFGTGNTDRTYLVVMSVCYIGNDYHKDYVVSTLIKIGAGPIPPPGPPTPPNPPTPPTPPAPSFPNEKYGLSTWVYKNYGTLVTVQNKKDLAGKFAGVLDGYIASVAAGTATNSENVLKDVSTANNNILTSLNVPRADVLQFFTQLQAKLVEVDNKVGLENVQNLKQCFIEIRDAYVVLSK